ncbi:MAG: hypothetical protein MAG451_00351 [Anaerolineales bacterium]|nr:hypothetical protein [Anaerolineales bacterium]
MPFRAKDDLLAVRRPYRNAVRRHVEGELRVGAAQFDDVDFPVAGLIRNVGHEVAVGRDGGVQFVAVGSAQWEPGVVSTAVDHGIPVAEGAQRTEGQPAIG